jgi:putative flippase GtrA
MPGSVARGRLQEGRLGSPGVADGPLVDLRERLGGVVHEFAKFGIVGAVNYVSIFNALVTGDLHHRPLTAKTLSTVVAATSSYFMNRHWTWRHRARRGLIREYGLFIVLSAVALTITLGCLAFGEYLLGEHSLLARNIWGNVVGIGAAMVWRFWSFKRWVFLEPEPERSDDAMHAALL